MKLQELHAVDLDMVPQLMYFQSIGVIYVNILLLRDCKESRIM